MQRVLVSFCNNINHPQADGLPVFLAEVVLDSGEVRPVSLPLQRLDHPKGATGLARRGDRILAILQHRPSILLELDLELRYVGHRVLAGIEGAHSILATPDELFVTATGLDRISSLGRDGQVRTVWQHGPGTQDTLHLNSVALIGGRLAVTTMGRRESDLWKTALHGYAFYLDNGDFLFEEIVQPHSLSDYFGRPLLLESALMNVRTQTESARVPAGYLRGIAFDDSLMVVGSSRGRLRSVSTGVLIGNPKGAGESLGNCALNLLQTCPGQLTGARPAGQILMDRYADEIFDILPLT